MRESTLSRVVLALALAESKLLLTLNVDREDDGSALLAVQTPMLLGAKDRLDAFMVEQFENVPLPNSGLDEALELACEADIKASALFLLKMGARPRTEESDAVKSAVMNGNLELLMMLHDYSSEDSQVSEEALRCASSYGDKELVANLLSWNEGLDRDSFLQLLEGAKTNRDSRVTALLLEAAAASAVANGDLDFLKELEEKFQSVPMNLVELSGVAAGRGHVKVLEHLFRNGAKIKAYTLSTMLLEACTSGHQDVASLLLETHASSIEGSHIESTLAAVFNNEPIIAAAENGNLDLCVVLEKFGADIHARSEEPLKLAVSRGHMLIVAYILEKSTFAPKFLAHLLQVACKEGHSEVAVLLLERGAVSNADGNAILTAAATSNDMKLFLVLLEYGANSDGYALLISALRSKSQDVASYIFDFLKERFDTSDLVKLLTVACEFDNVDIATRILKLENVAAASDSDAIITAAGEGSLELFELLVSAGAGINDSGKGKPLNYAMLSENQLVASYILETEVPSGEILNTRLQQACNHGLEAVAQLLLEKGASEEKGNLTCAIMAIERDNGDLFKKLMDRSEASYQEGYAELLKVAVEHGRTEMASKLIASCNGHDADLLIELFLEACSAGFLEIAELILNQGVDARAEDNAAVIMAARGKDMGLLEMLESKGADIHAGSNEPLRIAAANGDCEMAEYILEKTPDLGTPLLDELLAAASLANNTETVMAILKKRGNTLACKNSAIITAASMENFELVVLLEAHGADIRTDYDAPLIEAVIKGSLPIARYLLSKIGPLKDQLLDDLLVRACAADSVGIARLLLARRADPRRNNDSALFATAENGNLELLRLLEDQGGRVRIRIKHVLEIAVGMGHTSLVAYLLERNIIPSQESEFILNRLLEVATRKSHDRIAWLLLSEGAQAGASKELLAIAASKGNIELFMMLIKAGAESENLDELIYQAASAGSTEIVEHILGGADDKEPLLCTGLDAACRNGHTEVAKLLLENGAAAYEKPMIDAMTIAVNDRNMDLLETLEAYGGNVCTVGVILLELSARRGDRRMFAHLLKCLPSLKEVSDLEYVMEAACESDNPNIIDMLIEAEKSLSGSFEAILKMATSKGGESVVEYILESCETLSQDLLDNCLLNACGVFHENVASSNSVDIVKMLGEKGAEIHISSSNDLPLVMAVQAGNEALVDYLLAESREELPAELLSTQLLEACEKGYNDIAWILLEKGAEAEASESLSIKIAAAKGNLELFRMLESKGADPRVEDDACLKLAVRNRHGNVVEHVLIGNLIEESCLKDQLEKATAQNYTDIALLLLGELRLRDLEIENPAVLIDAAAMGNSELLSSLLECSRLDYASFSSILKVLVSERHEDLIEHLLCHSRVNIDYEAHLPEEIVTQTDADIVILLLTDAISKVQDSDELISLVKVTEEKGIFNYEAAVPLLKMAVESNIPLLVEYLLSKLSGLDSSLLNNLLLAACHCGDYSQTTPSKAYLTDATYIAYLLLNAGANAKIENSIAICSAAKCQNWNLVSLLKDRGADIDVESGLPLWVAIDEGDFVAAKFLISKGAKVASNHLHSAALKGDVAFFKLLEQSDGESQKNYLLSLHFAIMGGHELLVMYLVEKGIVPRSEDLLIAAATGPLSLFELLDRMSIEIHTPMEELLSAAIEENHQPLAMLFLKWGAKPCSCDLVNAASHGDSALFGRLQECSVEEASYLNESLSIAIEKGHFDFAKGLIEDGARPSADDVVKAAASGGVDFFESLKVAGVDISVNFDEPLSAAAGSGNLKLVAYLLENGANSRAREGSPLTSAARSGELEMVNHLLECGADPLANFSMALVAAAEGGHTEIVKLLVEQYEANPRARNYAALTGASSNGHADVVELLLSYGCGDDPLVTSRAMAGAALNDFYEIVELLQALPGVSWARVFENSDASSLTDGPMETIEYAISKGLISLQQKQAIFRKAAADGKLKIVEYLYDDSELDPQVLEQGMLASIQGLHGGVSTVLISLLVEASSHETVNRCLAAAMGAGSVALSSFISELGGRLPESLDSSVVKAAAKVGSIEHLEWLEAQGIPVHKHLEQATGEAVESGNVEMAWHILQHRESLDCDQAAMAYIQTAIESSNVAMLELLVAKLRDCPIDYESCLGHAAQNGSIEMVEYLCSELGEQFVRGNVDMAIAMAAKGGQNEMIRYLVSSMGGSVTSGENFAFKVAIGYGKSDVVRFLLSLEDGKYAEELLPTFPRNGGDFGSDSLWLDTTLDLVHDLALNIKNVFVSATKYCDKKAMQKVLEHMTLTEDERKDMMTRTLVAAARLRKFGGEKLALLLSQGADVAFQESEAAFAAACAGNRSLFKNLIKRGANITDRINDAFVIAAGQQENKDMLALLLKNGASIEVCGEAALGMAEEIEAVGNIAFIKGHMSSVRDSSS